MTTTQARGQALGVEQLARRGSVALVVALAANWLLTFAVGVAGVAPDLAQLSYGSVAMLTTAGVVGATVVYGLLTRLVDDPDRVFVGLAAVVLVVSLIPDFAFIPSVPGGNLAGGVVLAAMHVVTAAVSVVVLTGRPEWP